MKHVLFPVCLIILSLFAGCSRGNISQVRTIAGTSAFYSQTEIENAMDTAISHFRENFEGCTLLTMEYCEEKSLRSADGWAETYQADEAIVLLSSFSVDEKGGDGSFTPGEIYHSWQWVLVRSEGSPWQLKTWGYG